MRAREFITEYKKYPTREYEGVTFTMIEKGGELIVKALNDFGIEMAHVIFGIDGRELDPQDLQVDEKYQRQGIARVMYDYIKSRGFTINRSWDQTDAGAGFWDKHRGEDVRVWEAFDNPYKTKTEKSEYGDVDMLARLPDGTNLSIMFNNQGDDEWQVEFYRNNSQEVTGEGDAQRVFATVLTSMQKFIKKYKPWRLTFSANKDVQPGQNSESRAKLYNRLVQRYATAWGYEEYAEDHGDQITYELTRLKPSVAEGVPQPGPSSGAPKQFGPDAKIQTRQMTVKDIISSVPGVPYYNNVVDDWDAKDYSWGVTKKVIEYATYLKDHPESLAKLPPAIVLNGKFEDGAHRVSAIWLLQQRMDPKNPLWKNTKLNVQFVKQGVAEDDRVWETVHPDVTSKKYFIDPTENIRMGDFVFNARTFTGGLADSTARGLQIRAYDPKNLESSIGSADFIVKSDQKGRQWLESDDTEVDELHQGKGVAAMMYAFARSLGNDIKASPYKSKAGGDMWRKWGADAKHLVGEQSVAEEKVTAK